MTGFTTYLVCALLPVELIGQSRAANAAKLIYAAVWFLRVAFWVSLVGWLIGCGEVDEPKDNCRADLQERLEAYPGVNMAYVCEHPRSLLWQVAVDSDTSGAWNLEVWADTPEEAYNEAAELLRKITQE